MELVKKIDHKVFWPFSILTTLIFCLFAKGQTEIVTIVSIYIAVLAALYMLMAILYSMMLDPEVRATGKFRRGRLVIYMLLHILFLFGSIGIGVHFMGNRIILAVLNYVIQIFVLGIALRKNLK